MPTAAVQPSNEKFYATVTHQEGLGRSVSVVGCTALISPTGKTGQADFSVLHGSGPDKGVVNAVAAFLYNRALNNEPTIVWLPTDHQFFEFTQTRYLAGHATLMLDAELNGLPGGIRISADANGVTLTTHT